MYTTRKSTWFSQFLEDANWGDQLQQDDQATNAYVAAMRIILAAAGLHTSDASKVASSVHLPLPFVSATLWNLDRDATWVQSGYSELAVLISAETVDGAEVKAVLDCHMERFWVARPAASIDLAALWSSMTWVTSDKLQRTVHMAG